jgi:hypothetical protein
MYQNVLDYARDAAGSCASYTRARMVSLLWVWLFAWCLCYVYVTWLAPTFYYMGFPEYQGGRTVLWLAFGMVMATAAMLPLQINRLSEFFLWMIFFAVYTPSMLIVPMQGLLPGDGLATVCALALSFQGMHLISRVRIRIPRIKIDRRNLTIALFVSYATLNAYVAWVFGNQLRLVDVSEIYTQREVASDIETGSLVGYAVGFLSGAFNPFLMAVGLVQRRRLWLLVGILGQIFIYATSAPKIVLVSALIAPLLYVFLVRRPVITSARLGLLVMFSCLLPLAIIPLLGESSGGLGWLIVSLIFMRTYGTAGALTGVYAAFFSNHPFTYFSHINVISTIVHYPYGQSLGEVIGYDLVGGELDANANFWATDGIAAAGWLGMIAIGLVVGGFLSLCDGIVDRRAMRLALIAFIPFIMLISNTSFFSSLLTGGGGLLLLLLYVWQSSHGTARITITKVTV